MRKLPFSIEEIKLYDNEGGSVLLPVSEKEEGRIKAETESAGAEIVFAEKENLTAIKVSAEMKVNDPPCGYQSFLSEKCGISFKLHFEEEAAFMAIYQHKEWWIRPWFGKTFSELPSGSHLLIYKKDETYQVLLAVSGEFCRTDMSGSSQGIQISVGSGLASQKRFSDHVLVFGQGSNPYETAEQAADYALKLTGKRLQLRKEKKFPEIFEKIGWCTWDSLRQDVNEKAIFDKMDEFKEKQIPISWVLIDDGWSEVNRKTLELKDFDADPKSFPEGIGHTVQVLKEQYGVEKVGVWQAVKGYWNGVERDSEADRKAGQYLMNYPNGERTVRPDNTAVFGFWNLWHSYLKKLGVDFVKVDSQSSFSIMSRGTGTYGETLSAIHSGLDASAQTHFGGNLINCMGMAPENIWNRQSSALSRNSDDFMPTVPGSFGEHAMQNGYNSVYHGCFYWGDWDMAWSKHEDARPNMILRVISGGPVYLSDGCGNSVREEIMPIILEDGTLLRCQDVGRPTLDCLLDEGVLKKRALKLYNQYEEVTYTAAFSYAEQGEQIPGCISWTDIPGKQPEPCWVYDWEAQKAVLCKEGEGLTITLKENDASLYHLISAKEDLALLGILEKYLSRAAVTLLEKDDHTLFVQVKCGGTFAFLSEKEISSVEINGKKADVIRDGALHKVHCERAGVILKVCL